MKQIPVLIALVLGALPVKAAIPRSIAYQGVVSDQSGNPKPDGNYTFAFSFFADSAGGSSLWSESKVLPVKNGIVTTIFGQTTPINISFDSKYWLEISVNGTLLAGRVPLTSSAYALRADTADVAKRLANGTSGGNANFSGVVSADSGYFARGIQGQRLYVPIARIDSMIGNF